MPSSRPRAVFAVSLALFGLYSAVRLVEHLRWPVYSFETADGRHVEIEMPAKGRHFRDVEASFARYRAKCGDPTIVLYRTQKPDYSDPWDWYDIATHPRWRLPYIERPPRE
jgi:hypothetical protein